jgi:hypothetical protein
MAAENGRPEPRWSWDLVPAAEWLLDGGFGVESPADSVETCHSDPEENLSGEQAPQAVAEKAKQLHLLFPSFLPPPV